MTLFPSFTFILHCPWVTYVLRHLALSSPLLLLYFSQLSPSVSHTSSRSSSSELRSLKAESTGLSFLVHWAIVSNCLMVQYVQNPQSDTNLVSFSFPLTPPISYQISHLKDINALVGNNLPIKIPQVVVKWITTALVLHIAALIVTAVSALFGLLAHVREMSMTYFSTCISGFAALIALVAFIFDLILFGVAKTRIKSVGSAQIGSAVWLTFAAWVLLFFSGCFYSCGRNCISNRPSKKDYDDNRRRSAGSNQNAIKAEEAFRKPPETGLPSFSKTEIETRPLTGFIDGNEVRVDDDEVRVRGYAPLQSENRAVNALGTYPPGPQSQHTLPGAYMRAASGPQLLTTQHTPPYCEPACIPSEHNLN